MSFDRRDFFTLGAGLTASAMLANEANAAIKGGPAKHVQLSFARGTVT